MCILGIMLEICKYYYGVVCVVICIIWIVSIGLMEMGHLFVKMGENMWVSGRITNGGVK